MEKKIIMSVNFEAIVIYVLLRDWKMMKISLKLHVLSCLVMFIGSFIRRRIWNWVMMMEARIAWISFIDYRKSRT
jgi:hypothetical protein